MAGAYQGLGYLESGITEPLNRFAEKMLDFSALLRHMARHCLNRYHKPLTSSRTKVPSNPSSFSPILCSPTPTLTVPSSTYATKSS
jgi:hypothetical protein